MWSAVTKRAGLEESRLAEHLDHRSRQNMFEQVHLVHLEDDVKIELLSQTYRIMFLIFVHKTLGMIADVQGTMYDLTTDTDLVDRLPRVPEGIGFDHNFVLEKPGWDKHAAR